GNFDSGCACSFIWSPVINEQEEPSLQGKVNSSTFPVSVQSHLFCSWGCQLNAFGGQQRLQLGDGNPATVGDPRFTPLGAPASNLTGPNFPPPFPAFPSGPAGFAGALFQALRNFYGTDAIAFPFGSDEFNGPTQDNEGKVRP